MAYMCTLICFIIQTKMADYNNIPNAIPFRKFHQAMHVHAIMTVEALRALSRVIIVIKLPSAVITGRDRSFIERSSDYFARHRPDASCVNVIPQLPRHQRL